MDRVDVKTFSKLEKNIISHLRPCYCSVKVSNISKFLMRCVWKSRLRVNTNVGDWTTRCFRTADGLQLPSQRSKKEMADICHPVVSSSSQHCGAWQTATTALNPPPTGYRSGFSSISPEPRERVWSNQWTQMDTDRPHWGPCDRLRRSWEGLRGGGGPKDAIPASRDEICGEFWIVWLRQFPLTLSHWTTSSGQVRKRGAFPGWKVWKSESQPVLDYHCVDIWIYLDVHCPNVLADRDFRKGING